MMSTAYELTPLYTTIGSKSLAKIKVPFTQVQVLRPFFLVFLGWISKKQSMDIPEQNQPANCKIAGKSNEIRNGSPV